VDNLTSTQITEMMIYVALRLSWEEIDNMPNNELQALVETIDICSLPVKDIKNLNIVIDKGSCYKPLITKFL